MRVEFKNSVRAILNRVATTYRQVVFCTRWVICIGATFLVWGGALWFGSLAWDQKQGAVLAVMGFVGWLAVCRFVSIFVRLVIFFGFILFLHLFYSSELLNDGYCG